MNKRVKKKIEVNEMKREAVFVVNNKNGRYKMYIAKKYWNKGSKDNGFVSINGSDDYISYSYISNLGFNYICWVNKSAVDLTILKSWNNKNHLIKA
jgi:hypothetical protein